MEEPNANVGVPFLLLGQITNTLRRKGILDDSEVEIWRAGFATAVRDHANLAGAARICNSIVDDAINASSTK